MGNWFTALCTEDDKEDHEDDYDTIATPTWPLQISTPYCNEKHEMETVLVCYDYHNDTLHPKQIMFGDDDVWHTVDYSKAGILTIDDVHWVHKPSDNPPAVFSRYVHPGDEDYWFDIIYKPTGVCPKDNDTVESTLPESQS